MRLHYSLSLGYTNRVESVTPRKALFIVLGTIFVVIGVIGAFVPLLPTTPFLLLASACYARGSDRLHSWLMNHRFMGPYLRNIKEQRAMPMAAKVTTVTVLWISIAFSIIAIERLSVRAILVLTAICTTTYVLRMRTLRSDSQHNDLTARGDAIVEQPVSNAE